MPDESFVGRTFGPGEPYAVGREKVREFARAVGEASPLCHDVTAARAALHPDLVAPPTFAVVFTMPVMEQLLRDPEFGWDYARMVHGDQRFTQHRPVHAGDELATTLHVVDLKRRAGSHLLTLRCTVSDAAAEAVLETSALLVSQGGA